MIFKTSELCDRFFDQHHLQIAEPIFKSFGGKPIFSGEVATAKVFEDSDLLHSMLDEKGEGRVLVVDGGGSHRCALLDSDLAKSAAEKGWAGIIVYGCIRDSVEMTRLPIGVLALHAHPLKSHKHAGGNRDCLITFGGVNFKSGYHVYVDEDGIVVSEGALF